MDLQMDLDRKDSELNKLQHQHRNQVSALEKRVKELESERANQSLVFKQEKQGKQE